MTRHRFSPLLFPVLLITSGLVACGQPGSSGPDTSTEALGATSATSTSGTTTSSTVSSGQTTSTGATSSTGATTTSTAATSTNTQVSSTTSAATSSGATGTSSSTTSAASSATTSADTGSDTELTSSAAVSTATSAGETSTSTETGGQTSASSEPVFHVFMLMGQSNMAGVAKKQASDSNTDERIKVLGGCNQPAGMWNLANPPLSDCPGERGYNLSDSVDPGIWFAKTIVESLPEGHTIGLVGTAESGESINTFIAGGSHHNMILNKIAAAKTAPNVHLSGIIFHQGESDSGQDTWPDKVVQLYNEVKEAWGIDYEVPFILGELPNGGCCSGHNVRVHEAADKLPMGAWVTQEGTMVMDQYHFDHASVVLMGQRYGEAMVEALGW